jgi:hypothetical protein
MVAATEPRAYTRRDAGRVVKRQAKVAAGHAPRVSLAAMSRRHCAACGPESLHAGAVCCGCGRDSTPGKQRVAKRRGPVPITYSRAASALRRPIAEDGDNLLALMRSKA